MTDLSDSIKKLRELGKSYRQIEKELGCSRSTVAYHLSEDQRVKSAQRVTKFRATNSLSRKIETFKSPSQFNPDSTAIGYPSQRLRNKVDQFAGKSVPVVDREFSAQDVKIKFGEKTRCYLTGEEIDLNDPSQYSLDHIVPRSRGGTNSLDNMGVTVPWANMMKRDMTYEEFLDACEVILRYAGRIA